MLAVKASTGIEIELGYKNKIGDLNISANGSMAYLKNEVTLVDSGRFYTW